MTNKKETAIFIGIELIFLIVALNNAKLSLTDILIIGAAASFAGRAIAYLKAFEWLRAPFANVVKHSSGVGETVEPKPNLHGLKYVFANLICCPVCAGTWSALVIVKLYVAGYTGIADILAISAIGWLLTYLTEVVEWSKYKIWEETGKLRYD